MECVLFLQHSNDQFILSGKTQKKRKKNKSATGSSGTKPSPSVGQSPDPSFSCILSVANLKFSQNLGKCGILYRHMPNSDWFSKKDHCIRNAHFDDKI